MPIVVLVSLAQDGTALPRLSASEPIARVEEHYGLNPGDLHPVEAAVQLREVMQTRVIAVTYGRPLAELALREALIQGADEAVRIFDSRLADGDAQCTARILAAVTEYLQAELVLCGLRSGTGCSGEVGPATAEHLRWPFVGAITKLRIEGKFAIVERVVERGYRETLRCPLPAVFSAAPQLAQPRYAPLRQRLRAQRAEIRALSLGDLGILPEDIARTEACATLVSLVPSRSRPKKIFTPESSVPAAERIRLLMTGGLVQKKGEVIDSSTQAAAEAIVEILSREQFI